MRIPLILAATLVVLIGLIGCDAPVPPELQAPTPSVNVPSIPHHLTSPVEPTLAVEVTPERVYVSTHFLHETWRRHLRKIFEAERTEKHWLAAHQRVNELVETLDKERPTWRTGRVEAASLRQGRFTAESMKDGSDLMVQSLWDDLLEQVDAIQLAGTFSSARRC